jgi:hypothetical protein
VWASTQVLRGCCASLRKTLQNFFNEKAFAIFSLRMQRGVDGTVAAGRTSGQALQTRAASQ